MINVIVRAMVIIFIIASLVLGYETVKEFTENNDYAYLLALIYYTLGAAISIVCFTVL